MDDVNQRIARMEERLAWLERHVALQDRAMLEMAEQGDRLRADLKTLRDRSAAGAGERGEVEGERPPHY